MPPVETQRTERKCKYGPANLAIQISSGLTLQVLSTSTSMTVANVEHSSITALPGRIKENVLTFLGGSQATIHVYVLACFTSRFRHRTDHQIQTWECQDGNPNQVWNTGYLSSALPEKSEIGQSGINNCGASNSQDSQCQTAWIKYVFEIIWLVMGLLTQASGVSIEVM